jgi:hypothetical protein
MGHFDQSVEEPVNRVNRRVHRLRLGAGALALVLAGTLAACGGSDSSADTTRAASGTTAAQSSDTTAATTPADTTATTDTAESNGVADKSADEILAAAKAAAKGATAVHVSGDADGVQLDLNLVRGKGASGSMAQGADRFELITIGREIYLRGSDDFYSRLGGDAVVRLLAGKWLKVPATGRGFESFAAITDMGTLIDQALKPDAGSQVEKGDVETVDGTEAIGLTNGRGTLFIATTGDPFPLEIVPRDGRGGAAFDGWNDPADLTAPTDSIDIAQLESMSTN